ncbi:hypothetical protein TNCV_3883301, partial [Trichonephila clavipes]
MESDALPGARATESCLLPTFCDSCDILRDIIE